MLSVRSVLNGVLGLQLAIGAALVFGDMREGGFALPRFAPSAPRLTEPVRPGDQRRVFTPDRDRPATQPLRDPGTLPDRLVLTQVEGGLWRLEGAIAEGDGPRIVPLLDDAAPDAVILQSPGGSVGDALVLGRALRERGIGTRMLAGEFCYSACPYVLAGGEQRQIDDAASVGVHQHYFGENSLLPAFTAVEDIQRGQAEVMIYLDDMGIDPLVMQHALSTPPDEIYILLPEELERYGYIQPPEPQA